MIEIQLEFNLDKLSASDLRMVEMQKQIDTMSESMHKVRKKLFAEVGDLKKMVLKLQTENDKLKAENDVKFNYEKKDCLFSIEAMQEIAS